MNLNPKLYTGAAILFAILSAVMGYIGLERHSLYLTEKTAHNETKAKTVQLEASLLIKDSQLKRAYKKTKTHVLIGEKVDYIETEESAEETRNQEYSNMVSRLETENLNLAIEVDRLTKEKSSKGGTKRWNVGAGWLNTVGVYEHLGYRQDLGLIDITISGISNIPSFNTYGGSVSVGF